MATIGAQAVLGKNVRSDKPGVAPAVRNSSDASRCRIAQLDVLRGLAILFVLLAHQIASPSEPGLFRDFTINLHNFGQSGVDLFFVLSVSVRSFTW